MMKKVRSLISFIIIFLGFFYFYTSQNPHYQTGAAGHMAHGYVEIPKENEIPAVNFTVSQDGPDTWLLKLDLHHFTFAPEKAGEKQPSYNEGHAHLYINGKKISRLYGEYYHLGNLKEGRNEITITLNSNNHGALMAGGKPVKATRFIEVNKQGKSGELDQE
ncbi:hypothetical protein [Cytobacillus firmus]|uniref:Uncharacterized protein n=1 Tax=Cytobacillus firmus DS1 TaxID=1307436 RepID=W7L6E5_CYTFI|nr:hypothetical protein [Cytobacillus firmus]EWG10991.1 hypothetical protein PBF_10882 [Cytobacillus firmus DS1]